jgi:hypothetical protein
LEEALKPFDVARRDVLRELVTQNRDPQLERATDLLKGVNLFSKRTGTTRGGSTNAPVRRTE